ncbi:hypothetical protein [Phenylobacterium montanum]|uniref:Uncharacterized protein n=1 Tax=Phenylobacterium montanum TaxID=2823693 RepID=A0A975G150_9CAUL|nr:hypothetical protein [Caulobacter sp. S6]QUD89203.1 hypothetical protein KCG34_04795 [Caulobacter sp. S6]
MNAPVPQSGFDDADPALSPAEARALRHGRVLARLAEIGMEMAEALGREARARAEAAEAGEAGPAAAGDPGLAFSRIARAVRLTLALEARLAEGPAERASGPEVEARREAEAARRARAEDRALTERVGRNIIAVNNQAAARKAIETLIETEAEACDIEPLLDALAERLNEPTEADFADRPVSETIARICADLGLRPDWGLWRDEAWAGREAETRARGSPYAAEARRKARWAAGWDDG